jgi:hypothetical protein
MYDFALFFESISWVPTIFLNYCICIDLILVVRRPLSSHESRVIYYLIFTAIFAVITAVLNVYYELRSDANKNYGIILII